MKMMIRLLSIACLLLARNTLVVNAMPSHTAPFETTQPNGDVITLRLIGNEVHHFLEDLAGYTVYHEPNHPYVYATLTAQGLLGPTEHHVGQVDPETLGIPKGLKPTSHLCPGGHVCTGELPHDGDERLLKQHVEAKENRRKLLTGNLKNLVIPIVFSDHVDRPRVTKEELSILMNNDGPDTLAPTGSVKDFYYNNSYGLLTIESTVVDWVIVPETEAYYADGDSGTTKLFEGLLYALQEVDESGQISFSDFDQDGDNYIDAITFFHSGYGAETWEEEDEYGTAREDRIWSHKWSIYTPGPFTSSDGVIVYDYHINPQFYGASGTTITTIGVVCHETGHFMGLPDLYDGSNYLSDSGSYGSGIGSWGLMGNSWGFAYTGMYPPYLSAWARLKLGWLEAESPVPGAVSQVEASVLPLDGIPKVYMIGNGDAGFAEGEYLLIENRQAYGYDVYIPTTGLAVWHIDENAIGVADYGSGTVEGHPGQDGWPENGKHYWVALLQADGNYDLENGYGRGDSGDLFHSAGVNYLGPSVDSDGPYPNTDTYQNGDVARTGVTIRDISASGDVMTFIYERTGVDTPSPAASPVGQPTYSESPPVYSPGIDFEGAPVFSPTYESPPEFPPAYEEVDFPTYSESQPVYSPGIDFEGAPVFSPTHESPPEFPPAYEEVDFPTYSESQPVYSPAFLPTYVEARSPIGFPTFDSSESSPVYSSPIFDSSESSPVYSPTYSESSPAFSDSESSPTYIESSPSAPVSSPVYTPVVSLDFLVSDTSGSTDFFQDRRRKIDIILLSSEEYSFDDLDLTSVKFGKPGSETTLVFSDRNFRRGKDENRDGIIDAPYSVKVNTLGYEDDDLSLTDKVELRMIAVTESGEEISGSMWFDITGNEAAILASIPTESPTAAPVAPTASPQPTNLVTLDFKIDINSGETDFFTDRRQEFEIILFSNEGYSFDDLDLENIKFGKPGAQTTLPFSQRAFSRADDENEDGIVDVPFEVDVDELGYKDDDLSLVSEVELVMTATVISTGEEISGSVWFDITGNEEAIRLSIPTDSPTAAPVAPTISPQPTELVVLDFSLNKMSGETDFFTDRRAEFDIILFSSDKYDLDDLDLENIKFGKPGAQTTLPFSQRAFSRADDENEDGIVDVPFEVDVDELGYKDDDLSLVSEVELVMTATVISTGEEISGSVWFDITGNEEAIRLSIPTESPTAAPVAPTISPMPSAGCIEVEITDFEARVTSKSKRRGVEVEIQLISSIEADLSKLSDESVLMGPPEGNQVAPIIARSRRSDDIELLADLETMGLEVVSDVEYTIFVTGELTNGYSICGEATIILT